MTGTGSIQWPDTAAHGFLLRILRMPDQTVVVVKPIEPPPLDRDTLDALAALGFVDIDVALTSADQRQLVLARAVAGLSLRSIGAAFPRTRLSEQLRSDVFLEAVQSAPAAPAAAPRGTRFHTAFIEQLKSGSGELQFELSISVKGDEFTVGAVREEQLSMLVGASLAAQAVNDASEYPDGRRYENLDVELFAGVPGMATTAGREYGDVTPAEGLFQSWREISPATRASRRVWTVVEAAGETFAVPGVLGVDVVGWFVTERPWSTGTDVFRYDRALVVEAQASEDAREAIDAAADGQDALLPAGTQIFEPGAAVPGVWLVRLPLVIAERSEFFGVVKSEAIGNAASWISAHAPDIATGMEMRVASELAVREVGVDFEGDDEDLQVESESTSLQGGGAAAKHPSRRRNLSREKGLEDFGEKIGGARKDLAASRKRGWLNVDDIAQWNDFELSTNVTKANVWPTPDYRSLVNAGMPVAVALVLKRLRDGFASEARPGTAHDYVVNVGGLAERLSSVRDLATLKEALTPYMAIHRTTRSAWGGGEQESVTMRFTEKGDALDEHDMTRGRRRRRAQTLWSILPEVFRYETGRGEPLQVTNDLLRSRKFAGWPHQVQKRATAAKDVGDRDVVRPHLAHVQRIGGVDYRCGKDVTERDFAEVFGFRAGEFGNWLSSKDRQQTFNMAFDGLSDLAAALELPRDALSLGGTLAIAFGARGTGGRGAASAHYEPGRRVINLTKLSGAGALAHEWAHAFDHFLHDQLSNSMVRRTAARPYVSAKADLARVDRYPEVASASASDSDRNVLRAMSQMMCAAMQRSPTREFVLGQVNGQIADVGRRVRNWTVWARMRLIELAGVPESERGEGSSHPALAAFDRAMGNYHEAGAERSDMAKYATAAINLLQAAASRRDPKWATSQRKNMKGLSQVLVTWAPLRFEALRYEAGRISGMSEGEFATRVSASVETDFLLDAKRRDAERSSPYYSLPWEMFARAFEAVVHDRLADAGVQSDYLVHGVGSNAVLSERYGSPYPRNRDRVALSAAFEHLARHMPVERLRAAGDGVDASARPSAVSGPRM